MTIYLKNATWRWQWAQPVIAKTLCLSIDHACTFYHCTIYSNTFWDMNYCPVQTDGMTDRKQCIWAHRAICTGGLKKHLLEMGDFKAGKSVHILYQGEVSGFDVSLCRIFLWDFAKFHENWRNQFVNAWQKFTKIHHLIQQGKITHFDFIHQVLMWSFYGVLRKFTKLKDVHNFMNFPPLICVILT